MARFEIDKLERSDADAVARLHERCFEGYFLTHLGRWFLRRYYGEFCRHEFDYGVVARCDETNEAIGFVVGTSNAQAHFRSFYRRNMVAIVPLVAWRFFSDRLIRRTIWRRMSHIKAAVRSLVPGLKRSASETLSDKGPKQQCSLRMLSIAVAPEHRGSGAAGLLTAGFEEILRQAGHRRVGLSVLPDNPRAIAFYKKSGWEVTYSSDAGWWFEKDL